MKRESRLRAVRGVPTLSGWTLSCAGSKSLFYKEAASGGGAVIAAGSGNLKKSRNYYLTFSLTGKNIVPDL